MLVSGSLCGIWGNQNPGISVVRQAKGSWPSARRPFSLGLSVQGSRFRVDLTFLGNSHNTYGADKNYVEKKRPNSAAEGAPLHAGIHLSSKSLERP